MTGILIIGLAFVFCGIFALVAIALGMKLGKERDEGRLEKRLSGYHAAPVADTVDSYSVAPTALGGSLAVRRTVGVADKLVQERGFEESLAHTLAGAAVNLRPGEWMVIHMISTLGFSIGLMLLGGMSLTAGLLGLLLGFGIPYYYLSHRKSRRRGQFYSALPDTLSIVSGSLSAGYSLPQAFDAVVQETKGVMADELGRALIEVRLGSGLEEALDAVAERMESPDMAWIVMAIRIQREVGGNLAAVLNQVGATLRERESLRREVKTLSAEGRLSAIILGSLPILIALYLSVVRPEYLNVLFTEPLGVAMVVVGGGMFIAGIFWMRSLVRVEV
jgi:tight adherence protein B